MLNKNMEKRINRVIYRNITTEKKHINKSLAIKDSAGLKVTKVIVFVLFMIYAITLIFPFIWMFYNSFKTNPEFWQSVWSFPKNLGNGWKNFITAITMKKSGSTIIEMTLRSVFLTLAGTLLSLISSSTISYVVSKYKFKGRNLIYIVAITIMIVPTIGATSATYKLINNLGLYNNYLGILLLYSGGFGFQFLLLYGVFKSISWSYAEAAMVDGASDFKIFSTVMLPMAMPTLVPLAIMDIISLWNDYFTPYMYLKGKPTLAVGLQSMVSQMEYNANWPALFMLMIISMIPILIIFIVFQKQIMANVTAGGLKG